MLAVQHPTAVSHHLMAKVEDTSQQKSPINTKQSLPETHPTTQPPDTKVTVGSEPLAPPPKPAQTNASETSDYFSALHNGGAHFNHEVNPFEQSFGAPSSETPGKSLALPPVAALTSPAIPGQNSTPGYWQNSLRSGPLSPAMLPGPQNGDYFNSISQGFPTPNESSLRTGLTPGGGGSMFPAPTTPGTSALFQQLQSGAATPNTLDFQRTAINAAARNRLNQTSNTQNMPPNNAEVKADPFAQHDATDAANGLFMLAKGGQAGTQFAVPNQPVPNGQNKDGKRTTRASNGTVNGDGADAAESPDDNSRPNTRGGRGKKAVKAEATNGRRKSESTPKGGNKRLKNNAGNANVDPSLQGDDDDDMDDMDDMSDDGSPQQQDGNKKMTDEEKRRNFLERNRVAALKCRQRKKQWLANLQAKVEMYSAENDALNTQVGTLHEEMRNLRQLLMAHKDCPVGHAQGIGQYLNSIQDPSGFGNPHVNPYGMAMNGAAMQPMQRS